MKYPLESGSCDQPATTTALAKRRMPLDTVFALAGLSLLALAGAGLFWTIFNAAPAYPNSDQADVRLSTPRDLDAMSVDNADQIVVEGSEAQLRNAQLPLAEGALERAPSFVLVAQGEETGQNALKCLTQAIYYEAGFEPVEGRRAVAQVVLNRVRHPAYPNSVCGVVYQGSQRRTGCQFSFTCDGSLLRLPAAGAWRTGQELARSALAGHVKASVGTSTHYHADYVLPKWAFTLGKIQQIGRHIFYRFEGRAGGAPAFTARYAGIEAIPFSNYAQLRERALLDGEVLAFDELTPGLSVSPHITDRHASNDIGGRLDTRTAWRLSIPDPVAVNARFDQVVGQTSSDPAAPPAVNPTVPRVAVAESVSANGVSVR